ncbi:Nte1p [Sugiyamaella lignohabitans]|uniref:Lysophospholipase NTE1 n=1 Tax=Sugiyamaella lignohabitans TaxID=796027 RepID=A0A167DL88_9ASCO|nr:Nte1p [Sugiyamaella lignohabitans]ANB13035.1 Nte1p [Sugiyamaella lignohabitans]
MSLSYAFFRYNYLTVYSRLPPEQHRQKPKLDLFLDSRSEAQSGSGTSTYLDDFLSAIKVFGYLDRKVFHELTKHMTTYKLQAGETVKLQDLKGFAIVVDGSVEVFVKKQVDSTTSSIDKDSIDKDLPSSNHETIDGDNYQLLNEVKKGAPLSSLFTILSLFTENLDGNKGVQKNNATVGPGGPTRMRSARDTVRPSDFNLNSPQLRPQGSNSPVFEPVLQAANGLGLGTQVRDIPERATGSGLNSDSVHVPFPDTSNVSSMSAYELMSPGDGNETDESSMAESPIIPISITSPVASTAARMGGTDISRIRSQGHSRNGSQNYTSSHGHSSGNVRNGQNFSQHSHQHQQHQHQHQQPHVHQQPHLAHKSRRRTKKHQPPNSAATGFEVISQDIISRAMVNSTIAIIPEEAFRKLTWKYPKAASHIVQLILTHVQRVTFQTCHNYLRLTGEVFKTEEKINKLAPPSNSIPRYLHDSAIRRLAEKAKEFQDDEMVSLKPRNIKRSTTKLSNTLLRSSSRQVVLEPDSSHPGDLLSNVPLSSRQFGQGWAPLPIDNVGFKTSINFTSDNDSEDAIMRSVFADCIFKILGFDEALIRSKRPSTSGPGGPQSPFSPTLSAESSPLFLPVSESSRYSGIRYRQGRTRHDTASGYTSFSESRNTGTEDDSGSNATSISEYESAQSEASRYLEVEFHRKGAYLCKQNERCPGIYFVIDGVLEVGFTEKSGSYKVLHTVKSGGIGGFLGTILGYKSFCDIKAKTDVYVAFLPRSALELISDKYPMFYIGVAKTLTNVLDRLILHLDFALEWVQIPAGHVVFNQGEDADALYFVLNGRLRSLADGTPEHQSNNSSSNSNVVEEFGQGSSVGELEVLTSSKYLNTLHAIRDSELARFPRSLFESLSSQHPSLTFEITRLLASRISRKLGKETTIEDLSKSTFRTIAVLPITNGLPVTEFSEKLLAAFIDTNRGAVLLNNATMLTYLGRNAFNKMGLLKLSGYLSELEEKYQTVIYVADASVKSPWTQKCITQADCILLLADAMQEPDIGEYEHLLVKMKAMARTDLILLHPERYVAPGSTALWLKNRIWVHSHHHVQMVVPHQDRHHAHRPGGYGQNIIRARGTFKKFRDKVQSIQAEIITKYRSNRMPIYSSSLVHKNDFNRLARVLSGRGVGLVLGGGGARGLSHIGVIRALEENGIPIDFIGGTSIGSFIGGLYAREYDLVPIFGRAKKFASRVSSLWRMAWDLTYPATSYTTGHEFNRGIWKTFGDSRIEDFWLKFYTNTTNITHSRMEIHTSGYAWRYIRASMSLAGLLPPLTDKGSMLLDGGYVDNLPVSEMRLLGANVIFAVDVGSIDDTTPMEYGDTLSGLWVVFNRWNIFSRHPNVPNLAEIQQRLAYVSSVGALEKAKATPGVFYMRPPIDNYATLDFGKFDEIWSIGSQYGHETIDRWKREGKLSQVPGVALSNGENPRRNVSRRNSI